MGDANDSDLLRVRRFDAAKDVDAIKQVFRHNIAEEWTKYHDAKYLPNAKRYIETATTSPDSDFNNIEQIYFESGGFFWVLVTSKDEVVGMTGLEVNTKERKGELRRMCLFPSIRRKGWGTKLGKLVEEKAKELGLETVFLSTPEHGDDVLQFYSKLGFCDTGQRAPLHGSPIQEVFLEWKVQ
ncbi:Acetyltransferase (GNAT) family [Seminavis robusta]|uniref:Acetyltransferase (GNAT) family n=1 Tax=Seminavis robusta TaxID=568900 RepID=A0A9N8DF01_9STRA|nr:Acetyltransferase (GNAT) family [Seminavis robusta]|eukprot:Sro112_g055580.1 Acetyltransferase (GNAT) family (183) ;mRNA; f:36421-36969